MMHNVACRSIMFVVLLVLGMLVGTAAAGDGGQWSVVPDGAFGWYVRKGETDVFTVDSLLFGPDWQGAFLWAFRPTNPVPKADAEGRRVFSGEVEFLRRHPWGAMEEKLVLDYKAAKTPPSSLTLSYEFGVTKEVDLTGTGIAVDTAAAFFAGGRATVQVKVSFPGELTFVAENYVDTSDWFPVKVTDNYAQPSVIGMQDWLDKPAGKHGFLQMKGDRFVFEDGTPVKFWGANITTWNLLNWGKLRTIEEGELWADRLAKYGLNMVRLNRIMNPINHMSGIADPADSTRFHEPAAQKFDAFCAALAKRGIYYNWCLHWGVYPSPADKGRILAYDEIMNNKNLFGAHLQHSTYGLVGFASDLQDLHIAIFASLLNRKNTVTGRRYADEPALACVDFWNEDGLFWQATQKFIDECPTCKKLFHRRFSEWLRKKYTSQEKLREVWGNALQGGERLDDGTVVAPADSVGLMLDDALKSGKPARRLQDNMRFLFDMHTEFYDRMTKAIRATGYKGVLLGGNWQAWGNIIHRYNLLNDRAVGFIDRHNYYQHPQVMLSKPGAFLLSRGWTPSSAGPATRMTPSPRWPSHPRWRE